MCCRFFCPLKVKGWRRANTSSREKGQPFTAVYKILGGAPFSLLHNKLTCLYSLLCRTLKYETEPHMDILKMLGYYVP